MGTKIMLLCKETLFCKYAIKILESYFREDEILVATGDGTTPYNENWPDSRPDYVISFLSPWIVPPALLAAAQKAAINFHPGSPRYPGSGCYNFALYEKAQTYGVTCHHMKEKVDTGDIIMTSYFPVSPRETVETLKLKSMTHLLYLFEKTMYEIYTKDDLPKSEEVWLRKPYTSKQFNALRRLDPLTMDDEEIALRVRATDYCSKYEGAYFEVDGKRLSCRSAVEEPLV